MKTLLKVLAIILVIIVAALFIIPMVYKSEIVELTKKELNKSVNATIDFKDIDLSLFRNFPNFGLQIQNLSIVGKNEFSSDTLLTIKTIDLSIDLMSVFSSDNLEIKKVTLHNPDINVIVHKDGKSNYDITMNDSSQPAEENTDESSGFNLELRSFTITNGKLRYIDKELETAVLIDGLNHTLSGNLSSDEVILKTKTRASSLTVEFEGIEYLSNVSAIYQANIIADMANEIYTLGKNELILNNLFVGFDGSVSYVGEDLNLVLTFNSKGNEFKDILSLVPSIYKEDFAGLETEGAFSLNGSVKGIYNENILPSFNVETTIENGMFKYPGLPGSVDNIALRSTITNKGGTADNTIIDIKKFSMEMGGNPFHARFKISTPISDPEIDAKFNGKLNLGKIRDFYPLPDTIELSGNLIMDINLKGKLSQIESGNYEEFLAMGSFVAKEVVYNSNDFPNPIMISNAQLNFSPKYMDLVDLTATSGRSDFKASGKLNNYIAYYLKDDNLTGNLKLHSKYLNIDDLVERTEEGQNSTNDSGSSTTEVVQDPKTDEEPVQIPSNISLTLNSTFNKLVYDNLEMTRVKGIIIIKNSTLNLQKLRMNAVGGTMVVSGKLSTLEPEKPTANLKFNLKNMNINEAFSQFALIRKYLPLAEKANGLFSAGFDISTIMNKELMPDYSSLNGGGNINTKQISVEGINTMNQLASALKATNLSNMQIGDFNADFNFKSGKLEVQPTTFKYGNISADLQGWTGLDQSIGYNLGLEIPKSELGASANQVIENLVDNVNVLGTNFTVPDKIPVDVQITGTITNPVVVPKFGDLSASGAKEIVEEEIKKEVSKQAEKLIADARKEAQKLLAETRKQSNAIKSSADEAAKLVDDETDKQIKALMAEAKKNGFVAEMAAKEASKRLEKEADIKTSDLLKEAGIKADDLLKEAEKQAAKIISDAEKKAEKLKN